MDPSEPRASREWSGEMSPGEKVVAQWEARHDVAARGHRCDPLGVQHQLSRARVAERAQAARPRPAGATAAEVAPPPPESGSGAAAVAGSPEAASAGAPGHGTSPSDASAQGASPADAPAHGAPTERRHPWLHRLARHSGRP
ncbi:hypothetical protein [Geodermatophilus sp. URMC 63]